MSEEKGVVEGSVDSGAQVAIDTEAVLKEFKATYCVEGSVVLDAWIRQDFIEYCLSVDGLLKNPVPSEFKGMPTLITLFPRESDVGVSFTAAECDLVIAALNMLR